MSARNPNSRGRALDERLAARITAAGWTLTTPDGKPWLTARTATAWPERVTAPLEAVSRPVNERIANRLLDHGWTVRAPDGTVWEHTGPDDRRIYWSSY